MVPVVNMSTYVKNSVSKMKLNWSIHPCLGAFGGFIHLQHLHQKFPSAPSSCRCFWISGRQEGQTDLLTMTVFFHVLMGAVGSLSPPHLPGSGGGWIRSGDPDERIGMVFVNDRKYKCDGDELLGGLVFFCLGGWWWMMDDWRKFWSVSVEPFFLEWPGFHEISQKGRGS